MNAAWPTLAARPALSQVSSLLRKSEAEQIGSPGARTRRSRSPETRTAALLEARASMLASPGSLERHRPTWRVGRRSGALAEELNEGSSFLSVDPRSQLAVSEGAGQLGQQLLGHDQLEVPGQPPYDQPRRRSGWCKQPGDQYVGVENRSHSLTALRPGGVLGLDRQRGGVGFIEAVLLPQPLEQLEPKVAAKRLLDNLAVALPLARRPNLHPTQHLFFDRDGRSHLCHKCIIASG